MDNGCTLAPVSSRYGEFGSEPQCPCSCPRPHLTSPSQSYSPSHIPTYPVPPLSLSSPHLVSCVLCPHPNSIPHAEPHAPVPSCTLHPSPSPHPTPPVPFPIPLVSHPYCPVPHCLHCSLLPSLALVVSLCSHLINDNIHLCKMYDVSEICTKVYKDVPKHDLSSTKLRINWHNYVEQKDQKD